MGFMKGLDDVEVTTKRMPYLAFGRYPAVEIKHAKYVEGRKGEFFIVELEVKAEATPVDDHKPSPVGTTVSRVIQINRRFPNYHLKETRALLVSCVGDSIEGSFADFFNNEVLGPNQALAGKLVSVDALPKAGKDGNLYTNCFWGMPETVVAPTPPAPKTETKTVDLAAHGWQPNPADDTGTWYYNEAGEQKTREELERELA